MRIKQEDIGSKSSGLRSGIELVQNHVEQLVKEASQLEQALSRLNANIEDTRNKMQETSDKLRDLETEEITINQIVEDFHKRKDSVKTKNRNMVCYTTPAMRAS